LHRGLTAKLISNGTPDHGAQHVTEEVAGGDKAYVCAEFRGGKVREELRREEREKWEDDDHVEDVKECNHADRPHLPERKGILNRF